MRSRSKMEKKTYLGLGAFPQLPLLFFSWERHDEAWEGGEEVQRHTWMPSIFTPE